MFETFDDLLEHVAQVFRLYTMHPAQSIIIVRGKETAVVMPRGDHGGTISYRKKGKEFRRVSGRLEHIKRDLTEWKERTA